MGGGRLNTGVIKTNPLTARFIVAARMAVDLSNADMDNERRFAADHYDLAYSQFDGFTGSKEATIELLAIVRTASFIVWQTGDEYAASILRPIWREIITQEPGLSLEFFTFHYSHPDGM